LLPQYKNGGYITFTLEHPGKAVKEIHLDIKDVIQKKIEDEIARKTPKQESNQPP